MGNNRLPKTRDKLYRKMEDAALGADTHGEDIGLVHNTAALIRADRKALFDAETAANNTYTDLVNAKTAVSNADKAFKDWIRKSISVLKPYLGAAGAAWSSTGIGTTKLQAGPTQDVRYTQVQRLVLYFTANPARQAADTVPPVTAAHGQLLIDAMDTAREALKTAERNNNTAKANLKTAENNARIRMRNLIGELKQLLGLRNSLWHDFDLEEPGVVGNPAEPENLNTEASSSGTLIVIWNGAARATYYHLWLQIVGTDPKFRRIPDQFYNTEAIVRDLPSGATVKIYVIALNEHGQSTKSDVLEATVS